MTQSPDQNSRPARWYLRGMLTSAFLVFSSSAFSQMINDTAKKVAYEFHIDSLRQSSPSYQNRFSEYESNYIVSNFGQNDFGQVKFRISFKFDLKMSSQKNKLYFALTQNIFWDLYQKSAPMREYDFLPVVYFEHHLNRSFSVGNWWLKLSNYSIGYAHASNGQAGPDNRSLYKLAGSSDIEIIRKKPKQLKFTLAEMAFTVKAWIWNMVDKENYNISDYQGYGQLTSVFRFDYGIKNQYRPYQAEISDVFTPAKAGITNELNLKVNPFIGHANYDWIPYLFVQYFHGYGEGLLNYDNRNTNYRPLNQVKLGIEFRVF
jgi:phospholipase A1/A2